MTDLDRITAELAEVQRALLALPDGPSPERYELLVRQDRLREDAARYHRDFDAERPTNHLLVELRALRRRLDEIEAQRIDRVKQAGNLDAGTFNPDEGINLMISEAQGANGIRQRIGRIQGILIDRGVDYGD